VGSAIVGVAVLRCFITGFAFLAGPLIRVLCSKVQAPNGRDFGIAASTFTNWAANFVVGASFLTLLNPPGHADLLALRDSMRSSS
jgi:SP family galactose:H+ symporter-like MFS transporter